VRTRKCGAKEPLKYPGQEVTVRRTSGGGEKCSDYQFTLKVRE
jgi:hypothetical protein